MTTGSLAVASDAGSPSVALKGTGNAVVNVTDPPTGARLAPNTTTTFTAGGSSSNTVTVPVRCPAGVACTLDGTVVIATSDLAKAARSSATNVQTVARFSGVRVAPGKVREIKLKLSPAFIKSAQRRGIRLIRATLTIHTTFTDGTKATQQTARQDPHPARGGQEAGAGAALHRLMKQLRAGRLAAACALVIAAAFPAAAQAAQHRDGARAARTPAPSPGAGRHSTTSAATPRTGAGRTCCSCSTPRRSASATTSRSCSSGCPRAAPAGSRPTTSGSPAPTCGSSSISRPAA